jgi:MurNAc alpha-1-phosphate uridylyltransferase
MTAMILAAGRGERLRPLTDTTPKALIKVQGERLIDRHLQMLAEAGVKTVVINLGWLGEQIVEHVGSGQQFGLQVVYSPEYDNVLETGGGIHRALPTLGNAPFWVVNADIYTEMTLPEIEFKDGEQGHLVLVPMPAYKTKGDFDLLDGKVAKVSEPSLMFGCVAHYRPEFFAGSKDGRYSLAPLLFAAAAEGRLGGSIYAGVWEDVGTPERLHRLNNR